MKSIHPFLIKHLFFNTPHAKEHTETVARALESNNQTEKMRKFIKTAKNTSISPKNLTKNMLLIVFSGSKVLGQSGKRAPREKQYAYIEESNGQQWYIHHDGRVYKHNPA